jgi:diaminopimelate dehydrogenase
VSKHHVVTEPPERWQVAVVGPGKLGRACALALLDDPKLLLAGVVERPGFPGFLRDRLQHTVRATHIRDLPEVDMALVCVPSLEVSAVAHDLLQSRIPMVECARLEGAALQAHYRGLEEQAHRYRTTAVYGAGWNPGVLPLMHSAFHVLIPRGRSVAHRHPGVQMHHSVSVSQLHGVKQALEGEFSGPDGQSVRCVYVELARGASLEAVRGQILADPLFAGEATQVFQMDSETALVSQENQGLVLERLESADAGHHAVLLLEARFDVHQFAARAMLDAARRLMSLRPGAHPYSLSVGSHALAAQVNHGKV